MITEFFKKKTNHNLPSIILLLFQSLSLKLQVLPMKMEE